MKTQQEVRNDVETWRPTSRTATGPVSLVHGPITSPTAPPHTTEHPTQGNVLRRMTLKTPQRNQKRLPPPETGSDNRYKILQLSQPRGLAQIL
jgi:hypothetical protein